MAWAAEGFSMPVFTCNVKMTSLAEATMDCRNCLRWCYSQIQRVLQNWQVLTVMWESNYETGKCQNSFVDFETTVSGKITLPTCRKKKKEKKILYGTFCWRVWRALATTALLLVVYSSPWRHSVPFSCKLIAMFLFAWLWPVVFVSADWCWHCRVHVSMYWCGCCSLCASIVMLITMST